MVTHEAALFGLEENDRNEFESFVQSIVSKRKQNRLDLLSRTLKLKRPYANFPTDPERYAHNCSSLNLNKTLLEALSLGPKFCYPKRNISQLDLATNFEHLHDQVADLVPSSNIYAE